MASGVIRSAVFRLLRFSGLPWLFRETVQRDRVTVLVFHDPSPAAAERIFAYLAAHYNVISLRQYVDACRRQDGGRLPPKALVVTFDDGHRRNAELAALMERYAIPAAIFLCSSIVDTHRHFWFMERHPVFGTEALKRLPTTERLRLLAEVGFTPEREYATPQALDAAQISDLTRVADMHSHTMFHPCLPQSTDAEARRELEGSKRELEEKFGIEAWAIAYPNGDYSDRVVELAQHAGYECGLTTDFGFNSIHTDLFKIKRVDPNDPEDMNELIVKASGVWGTIRRMGRIRGGHRVGTPT